MDDFLIVVGALFSGVFVICALVLFAYSFDSTANSKIVKGNPIVIENKLYYCEPKGPNQ